MSGAWPATIHAALKAARVRQVAYVPDAGHAELLRLVHADSEMQPVLLATEEEGIGVLAGAWLGGDRGVLLMQSSGVGNCINALSIVSLCRLPFLTLVTMRGEWGEFNPWQVPMAAATAAALKLMGIRVQQVARVDDVAPTVQAAAAMAFDGGNAMAVLIGQRVIGAKEFVK